MAIASDPSPTPNPDALKFVVDVRFDEMVNVAAADAHTGDAFVQAVFAAGGVASVFAMNDFVTITREAGADWEPITAAVQAAAAEHL